MQVENNFPIFFFSIFEIWRTISREICIFYIFFVGGGVINRELFFSIYKYFEHYARSVNFEILREKIKKLLAVFLTK